MVDFILDSGHNWMSLSFRFKDLWPKISSMEICGILHIRDIAGVPPKGRQARHPQEWLNSIILGRKTCLISFMVLYPTNFVSRTL